MTDFVLLFERQLGAGLAEARIEEMRIVAEAAAPRGASMTTPSQMPSSIIGSGSPAWRTRTSTQ
jgi:hypothetical protein